MHAAKHFDPELGIDIHLYIFPPVPTPIPLPTPHIGIVLDPFDYLPIIGGTVHVNGVKRATAGTNGLDVHIPLGPWVPPPGAPEGPQFDGEEIFMGSMTVVADGDPFSRLAMPVLDCNIVGMINPFRLKKPAVPQRTMSLPTAVNLAIPNHVNVGGPPMISIMGMAFKGLFAGLGALRRTQRFENAMERFRNFRRAHFGELSPGFLKCKILRAEPVDIRRGTVSVTHEDFAVPGRLPLAWTRRYGSGDLSAGLCGPGWRTPADTRLALEPGGAVVFRHADGAMALFAHLPPTDRDDAVPDLIDGAWLTRRGGELQVRTRDDVVHVFAAPPANIAPLHEPIALAIERLEDRCGNHWRFERVDGRLVRIVESGIGGLEGRFIEVDASGGRLHRLALHDPGTGTTFPLVRYAYDAAGDLVAAHDALDAPRRFAYREHRMVRHTDRVGLSFHYAFDAQWRVVHAWGDGGLHDYRFRYDALLNETEVTDSLGHVSIVKFDGDGLPLAEIDPLGGMTVFEYDEAGRTTAITDPAGLRTGFGYDERGNLVELKRPDDTVIASEFDDGKAVAITDADGGRWTQVWDRRGLLVAQITPLGATTRYEHDAHGQLLRQTNPRGAVTHLAFDRHGLLASLTDALGHVTRFEHDALGRLRSRTDAAGRTSSHVVDAKGRLLESRQPSGATVRCEYDAEDQIVRYVDERGGVTRIEYTGIGRAARRVQPDGHAVRYLYDTEERLAGVVNQRGETYRLVRDPLGRVVEEVDYWGQPRRYAYDAAGHLRRSVDPLGRAIAFACDKLGRIVAKTLPDPADPSRQVTETFRYGKAGQLLEMRNAVAHVKRRFDADGRLVEESQNGFKVENGYDEVGNRTLRRTSAGNAVAVAFDLMDRPVRIAINDEPPITIERDAMGRAVREVLSPNLSRTLRYDVNGMMAAQAVFRDGVSMQETRWERDDAGNLTRRLDSVQGVDRYAYDPIGQILAHTDPAGRLREYVHDPAGDRMRTGVHEVEMRQSVGGAPVLPAWTREGELDGLHCVFDRAGNLVTRTDRRSPAQPVLHLSWDANQRLAESRWERGDRDGHRTSYGYDPLGRRVFKRDGMKTTWFFWDEDTLLAECVQPGRGEFEHDDNGDRVVDLMAARRRSREREDAFATSMEVVNWPDSFVPLALVNAPVVAPAPAPRVATWDQLGSGLALGAEAERGVRQVPAAVASMSLGQGARLGQVLRGDAAAAPDRALGGASPGPGHAEPAPGSSVLFVQTEPNGCATRLMRGSGELVWAARLGAWGAVDAEVGEFRMALRLQGQYVDAETGLHYNRYRYFDPAIGQFVGADPLRLEAGENLHAYAPNTLGWVDPLGLDELYALVAGKDGWYPVMEWGKKAPVGEVFLRRGELWKLGETKNPLRRYSLAWLNRNSLEYKTVFSGDTKSVYRAFESMKLAGYEAWHGHLPPGNKCRH